MGVTTLIASLKYVCGEGWERGRESVWVCDCVGEAALIAALKYVCGGEGGVYVGVTVLVWVRL